MNKKIDLEEIRTKVLLKLEPSGWKPVLKSFIESSDFEKIILQLIRLTKDGKRFTPPLKDVFRAFEECPYDKLKVVIVGQDPYPQFDVADGIAFSCSKTNELQPSLRYILNEVNLTVYGGHPASTDVDLSRWAKQGVLLLNTAFTTTVGKIGQHYNIWKPFIAYLFDHLTWSNNGLVYIYMGKQAQDWADCVNDNNYKFLLSHPASAAYNSETRWDSKNVFLETQVIIKQNYNEDLIW
jgi:uracil-DNA glycosylase